MTADIAKPQDRDLRYALITPARNEAKFIAATIRSVVAQTVHPAVWIVVSDGSTDGTDEIVERYAREHDWISLLRMPERRDRSFAAKATAFNAAYARLAGSSFDIIGNLDADITLAPDHFERLLAAFEADPHLGIAGGMVHTRIGTRFVSQNVALDSVAGAANRDSPLVRRTTGTSIGIGLTYTLKRSEARATD